MYPSLENSTIGIAITSSSLPPENCPGKFIKSALLPAIFKARKDKGSPAGLEKGNILFVAFQMCVGEENEKW